MREVTNGTVATEMYGLQKYERHGECGKTHTVQSLLELDGHGAGLAFFQTG